MTLSLDEHGYVVVASTGGDATITALDTAGGTFTPRLVTRVDQPQESGNIITELLDGTVAVAAAPDRKPAGELELLFDTDAGMAAARAILSRGSLYRLEHAARPVVNMTFVRRSALDPGMHDQVRRVWVMRVGFQEVTVG